MRNLKIERGALVVATDGEVGRVSHVVVDRDTRDVTDLVVDRGGREVVIPVAEIANARRDRVTLRGPRSGLAIDSFDRDQFRPVDDVAAQAESAGRPARGGTPLLDADDDAVVVGDVTSGPVTPRPPTAPSGRREELRLPVAVEKLEVEKRQVELGAIEVRKTVVTEEQSVPIELMREELHVEHLRMPDQPVTGDVADLFREGTIRVRVRGEDAVAAKQAYVTSEVVIDRKQLTERRVITDTIRKERVIADEIDFRQPAEPGERIAPRGTIDPVDAPAPYEAIDAPPPREHRPRADL